MRTVFAGGRVFDGTGAALAEADVAIEDGLIAEVGAGLDGDEQVDVAGSTLLPGLFDTHVHVMFGHVDMWRYLQTPFSYRFFDAIKNLDATIRIGITTVRDAGGADLGVKQAVEEGIVRGPRLQISLTMLSQTGGHGDGWMPSGGTAEIFPNYPGMPSPIVDGVDEARRRVRELVRNGADVIKIATSGGVLSPRDSPDQPGFSLEEIEVMVEEARAVRALGDVARAVDRGDQERRPRRCALDRARHLPRRRGDRADARARRVSSSRRSSRRSACAAPPKPARRFRTTCS